jgi:hypothetical protein
VRSLRAIASGNNCQVQEVEHETSEWLRGQSQEREKGAELLPCPALHAAAPLGLVHKTVRASTIAAGQRDSTFCPSKGKSCSTPGCHCCSCVYPGVQGQGHYAATS